MTTRTMPKLKRLQRLMKKNGVSKVFDSHTHAFERQDIRSKPKKPTIASSSYSNYPLERSLKVAGIVFNKFKKGYKQVVFGLPAHNADIKAQNNRILSKSRKNPNLVPLAIVSPEMTKREIESLARKGFSGFKPYPEQYKRFRKKVGVNLYLTKPILEVANKHGLPIILHATPEASSPGSLKAICSMASNYPNVKLVLAHMGKAKTVPKIRKLCKAIKNFNNVYLSTSIVADPRVFEIALRELGSNRVMFGSDFPWALMHGTQKKVGKRFGSKEVPQDLRDWQYFTRRSYKWTDKRVQEFPSKKAKLSYNRFIVSELDALLKAIGALMKEGLISERDVRKIFYGNAQRVFKRR